jgi:hypothetical protein
MGDERLEESERLQRLDVLSRALGMHQLADEAQTKGSMVYADFAEKIQNSLDRKDEHMATLAFRNTLAANPKFTPMLDYGNLDEKGQPTAFFQSAPTPFSPAQQVTMDGEPYVSSGNVAKMGTRPASETKYGRARMVTVQGQDKPVLAQQGPGGKGWFTTDAVPKPIEGVTGILRGSASDPPNPDVTEHIAQMIAQYRMAPYTGYRAQTGIGPQVMARVAEINPQYDATKYAAKQRAAVAFTSGRQGDAIRRFSVSFDHLDIMQKAADALQNGDVRTLNAVKQYVAAEMGYEGPIDFDFVKSIVGDEIANAVIGGVGASRDREEIQKGWERSNSPEQLAGVTKQAKKLITSQMAGFERQSGQAGFTKEDFNNALSPKLKEELKDYHGHVVEPHGARGEDAAVPTITNKSEYDALPSGSRYYWNGRLGTKP